MRISMTMLVSDGHGHLTSMSMMADASIWGYSKNKRIITLAAGPSRIDLAFDDVNEAITFRNLLDKMIEKALQLDQVKPLSKLIDEGAQQ